METSVIFIICIIIILVGAAAIADQCVLKAAEKRKAMSNNQTTENTNLQNQVYNLRMAVIFLFVLILIAFCFNGYTIGKINGYIEGKEQGQISTYNGFQSNIK